MRAMLETKSLSVDFSKEKEDGYKRIFSRSPLLTSLSANWSNVYLAYDWQVAGETPEVLSKQHGVAIFSEVPTPIQAERRLDGRFQSEQVTQGNIVVAPAYTGHRACWDTAGGVILLGFEPTVFAHAIYESVDPDRIELLPHFATPDPLVYQIGLALKSALENYGADSRLYAEAMTNALIVHLLQHYSTQQLVLREYSGGLPKHKLQQVIDYINTYLAQDLSLKELAAVVQMSSHYFSQLFKQSTGATPHQYIIRCRIEKAKQLLLQREFSLAEIASQVGFVDQSHLNRHFKRLMGVTPKMLEQKYKK
ncbi:AraC family transcriptional regulator [Nostoc sphaeroides CCNUC1]|uniref:AraC family transcriptional regulator n=2 Tax=Nostoc sphaeroides TaxID=446679 RepID=A0A5P8VUP9_9NOSO|nr:AraC family transcriptional regulator [Nostoc sphaeroides CCNUC1]